MGAIEGQNRLPKDAVGSFVTRPGNRIVVYVMFAYNKAVLACYRPKFMASISGSHARGHSVRAKSSILESSALAQVCPRIPMDWQIRPRRAVRSPKALGQTLGNSIMLRVMGQRKLRDCNQDCLSEWCLRGTPKGQVTMLGRICFPDPLCRRLIAERRMYLAGYRLADPLRTAER